MKKRIIINSKDNIHYIGEKMVTILTRLFIKDYKNTSNTNVRRAYGMLCSIVGIVLNIILFAGKFFAGTLCGSVAITADSFNNLSDAGSSFISLIGFKFSGLKPDPEHPFGHGRIEYLAGLLVSMLVVLMGFELLKSSIQKIISAEPISTDKFWVVIGILVASILVKAYMALYNTTIGKKISSMTLKATATDSLGDTVATTVVLISTIVAKTTGLKIDGWCGLLVAGFILWAGIKSAKETLSPLLGQAPDPELVSGIEKLVMSYDDVVGIHDMVVHDYGPGRLMVSLHAEVPGDRDIYELHDTIDCIENTVFNRYGCETVIHMDPIELDNEVVKENKEKIREILKDLSEELTFHDFRMVSGPTHNNLIFDVVVPFKFKMNGDEVVEWIEKEVEKRLENTFVVIKVDTKYA